MIYPGFFDQGFDQEKPGVYAAVKEDIQWVYRRLTAQIKCALCKDMLTHDSNESAKRVESHAEQYSAIHEVYGNGVLPRPYRKFAFFIGRRTEKPAHIVRHTDTLGRHTEAASEFTIVVNIVKKTNDIASRRHRPKREAHDRPFHLGLNTLYRKIGVAGISVTIAEQQGDDVTARWLDGTDLHRQYRYGIVGKHHLTDKNDGECDAVRGAFHCDPPVRMSYRKNGLSHFFIKEILRERDKFRVAGQKYVDPLTRLGVK